MICIFLSLGGVRKPTKTYVLSAFLELLVLVGSGQVLEKDSTVLCMFGAGVTILVDSPGSELHGVFSLCNICDSFGEGLGVRFLFCFQLVQHL